MIHTPEHIAERLNEIQAYLEAHYDGDEGHAIMNRLTEVAAFMAESGKLKADAEWHYDQKLTSEIMDALRNKMPEYTSATVQNKIVASLARDEKRLVTFADRINRSATHQVEAMRTQLSYIKTQMSI